MLDRFVHEGATDYVAFLIGFAREATLGAVPGVFMLLQRPPARRLRARRGRPPAPAVGAFRARLQDDLDPDHEPGPDDHLSRRRCRAGACSTAPSSAARPRPCRPCSGTAISRASPGSPTRTGKDAAPGPAQRVCRLPRQHDRTPMAAQVLKFMGDGILAMFPLGEGRAPAPGRSSAAAAALEGIDSLSGRRAEAGLPRDRHPPGPPCRRGALRQYRQPRPARLHRGRPRRERGRPDRGHVPLARPARDHLRRLRRGGRPLPQRLVSLGRYALRGVRRPEELFTIDPDACQA